MNDLQTVTEYRNNVVELSLIRQRMQWNYRHCLPVAFLAERATLLKSELIRFDEIIDRISDRTIRNVLCIRYALGMTVADTAFFMNMSKQNVMRLDKNGIDIIKHAP